MLKNGVAHRVLHMDATESDRIAARAIFSCVGEICYRAATEEGDITAAPAYERRLRTAMKRITEDRMARVVRFTLDYLGGKYNFEDPVAVRGELESLINNEVLN